MVYILRNAVCRSRVTAPSIAVIILIANIGRKKHPNAWNTHHIYVVSYHQPKKIIIVQQCYIL